MKLLLALIVIAFSLNAFSVDVGEDQKGQCIYGNQGSRVAESEKPKSETKDSEEVGPASTEK